MLLQSSRAVRGGPGSIQAPLDSSDRRPDKVLSPGWQNPRRAAFPIACNRRGFDWFDS